MGKIWYYIFYDEFRKMDADLSRNPHTNCEYINQTMFETFGAPAMYTAIQAVMALYTSGRNIFIVTHFGDGVFHRAPIYEG